MSSEAVGWTFRYSPLTGASLLVHLAIADSVSDQHGYQFWMRQEVLARKARTTRQTVNVSIERLIDAGALKLLIRRKGGANRYKFLMPAGLEPAFSWETWGVSTETTTSDEEVVVTDDTGVSQDDEGVKPDDRGVVSGDTKTKGTQTEPKQEPKNVAELAAKLARFPELWTAYPKGTYKKDTEAQWCKEVKAGAEPDDIIAGAVRYATSERVLAGFVMDPHRWLRAQRWKDEDRPAPPPDTRSERVRRGDAAIDRFLAKTNGHADSIETTGTPADLFAITQPEEIL